MCRRADGCGWTAASAVPWMTISSGGSGTGNGTVRFTAAANSWAVAKRRDYGRRPDVHGAAGQRLLVSRSSSSGQNVPAAGGNGSVNVSTGGGCGWTATSNASWLTITSGANGAGNGSVGFTAAANTGTSRPGALTIGGQHVHRDPGWNPAAFTISPEQVTVGAAAGDHQRRR